jgi:hypothetical protein
MLAPTGPRTDQVRRRNAGRLTEERATIINESFELAGVGLEADVMQQTATLLHPSRATRWRSSTVELLICNQGVVGSIPIASFTSRSRHASGEVPEWPKGADCKSAGVSLRRFESSPLHRHEALSMHAGIAQLARASAFQAEGRGFESRFPLCGRRPISAHLLRCSVARLRGPALRGCGVASATPPRSRPRASHLGTSRPPAVLCGLKNLPRFARLAERRGWAKLRQRYAQVAQLAEHVLGKDEVGGSIPLLGSRDVSRRARVGAAGRKYQGGVHHG